MTELIGLSGYARTGKDTVAQILGEHGYRRASFADKLRDAVLALDPMVDLSPDSSYSCINLSCLIEEIGWEAAKDAYPDVRRLLQRMGTDVGRAFFGQDVWADLAMAGLEPGGRYVFTDVRFPNEADAIRAREGHLWRVRRPGFAPVNAHPSETALDCYRFDWIVENDSNLAQLRRTVEHLLEDVSAA